jgi:hypothetical protein
LNELRNLSPYVFPGERDHERPMSNNTILKALERLGYKHRMTGHGFRGVASTLLHEMSFPHPRRCFIASIAGAIGLWLGDSAGATDEHEQARSRLLAEIESDLRDTASATGRRQFDPAVLAAIADVPRHRFVPPQVAALAYSNRPLAIGHGQTISQPFIVALMTQLIDPKPTSWRAGTAAFLCSMFLCSIRGTRDYSDIVCNRDITSV